MNVKIVREGNENISLLEQLRKEHIFINAVCGGKGICGKCRVRMLSGITEPTMAEQKFFSKEELEEGWRLACMAFPKENCHIDICINDETQFEIVSDYNRKQWEKNISEENIEEELYDIGIDLGTTTIALELIGKKKGQVVHTVTAINRQRTFGADVISRIQSSNNGNKEALQEYICKDLYEGIKRLLSESHIQPEQIEQIGIVGNTTMGHLLMGYSCETLGVYPFTPVNMENITKKFDEIFWKQQQKDGDKALQMEVEVSILSGISAFVGADVVAGILACEMDKSEEICLLIDLGTNGEMAIGNKDKILVTSTAAGPAFEGGNISCGVGSIPGAICNVSLASGKVEWKTIGDKPPIGLCGTGVVEIISELLKENFVDETGMMLEEFSESGFRLCHTSEGKELVFTQKDVREIQLAKAAIRAGVEVLLKRYGVSLENVEKVFLAGGFGYKIDVEKAIVIGMLAQECKGKVIAVGNSALHGIVKYLTKSYIKERWNRIIEISSEVELAMDGDFNDFYMKYMFFDRE